MSNLIINGKELEKLLGDFNPEYKVVELHYKFFGVDHDLWEFQTIVQRILDKKFFKINWFDNYSCSWEELGLYEEDFELIEVFPKKVTTIIYE